MTTDEPTSVLPKLRFPDFRDAGDWRFEPLGEIAELISDRAGTTVCIPMSITTGVGLVSQEEKFGRTIAGDSYKNYIRLRRNDFAYNKSATKEFPQGYAARYTGTKDAAVPNSIFTCFRPNSEAVVPQYLDYLFQENYHGRWLRKYITVGARANGALSVSDDDLMSMPVPLPPVAVSLREQQAIADCLGSLDEIIDAEFAKFAALGQHKRGLLRDLFPQNGSALPSVRFPEYRNTEAWIPRRLGEVADYENGKAYEKDIVDDGRFVVVNARFVSTNGAVRKHTNETYCIAQAGDVLMVLSDLPSAKALARCFLVEDNDTYAVNQRVAKIRPHAVDSRFLLYALDRHPWLMAFSDGLNQTHLSKGTVLDCPLVVPRDDGEQRRIAVCLETIDTQLTAQEAKLSLLTRYKHGLLEQLFPRAKEASR